MLGGLLRGMKQLSARFLVGDAVRLCRRRWQPTTLAFQRFCGLRVFAASAFLCHQFDFKVAAKRRKPQKVGPFPFQPLAGALFRLSAAINKKRLLPQPLATINNAETRAHELKTHGQHSSHALPEYLIFSPQPKGARLSISLATYDSRTMCIL